MAATLPWDRNAAHVAIKAVCDTATDLVFVKANQGAPASAQAYGTFLITAGPTALYGAAASHTTYDAGGGAGAEITEHTGGQAKLSVSLQAFSTNQGDTTSAMAYLDQVSGYFQTAAAKALLGVAGLALGPTPPGPTEISAPAGADIQSRAILNVELNMFLNIRSTTGYINVVEVTANTIDDVEGNTLDNSTQTITGV